MVSKSIFTVFIFSICFISCSHQHQLMNLDFLVGTWQVEGKATFEEWKKEKDQLVGLSYKLMDGHKKISETLLIKAVAHQTIYEATVINQNDGKSIAFTLNRELKDKFSFENPTHDFPKKIQYQQLSDTAIFVNVLGANDEGFSFKMIKQ